MQKKRYLKSFLWPVVLLLILMQLVYVDFCKNMYSFMHSWLHWTRILLCTEPGTVVFLVTQCSWKIEQLEKVGLTYKTLKYSGKSEERMVSVMHQYRICKEVQFIGSWKLIWKPPWWIVPRTSQTVPSGLFLDMLWFG